MNKEAYKLLHNGCVTLSQVETNGMRIDEDYLHRTLEKTSKKIHRLTEGLKQHEIYKAWKKVYGTKTNLGSHQQLGKVLFDVLKYESKSTTKTGRHQTDVNALEGLDIPFVKDFLTVEKLKKANSTYLKGILRESVDGYIHPVFNLHIVQTYRSSSDSPNFQNIPIRNPKISKLVRRCFIARPEHQIVEVDYSGIEVHAASWYHKDPRMLEYICNPKKDMHRDMAMQCYKLSVEEMTPKENDKEDEKRIKQIRYCGKNMFVFPEFYGDYYIDCARSLWSAVGKMKLNTREGGTLIEHLRKGGIKKLGNLNPKEKPLSGTFEKHIQEVENDFWNNRFKVYGQWRKDWYNAYKETGKFSTLTGFEFTGFFKRNEVINYPVQGVAFHCLLWSLIRIQKLLNKYKMRSLIVGQIHDSIVADVFKKELKQYLEICKQVMTVDIKKHWNFIITPIAIEAEVAPVNGSWFEKEKWKD